MRYAIMLLQMALELYGENIDVNDINNLIGAIPEKEIFELLKYCFEKDFDQCFQKLKFILDQGYIGNQIVCQIGNIICSPFGNILNDHKRAIIMIEISNTYSYLCKGGDTFIQIFNLLCTIMKK